MRLWLCIYVNMWVFIGKKTFNDYTLILIDWLKPSMDRQLQHEKKRKSMEIIVLLGANEWNYGIRIV